VKRIVRKLLEAAFFLLCFGPIPLIVGFALTGDGFSLLTVSAAMVPAAFVISLLPGYVGGAQKKQEAFVERTASHGDPDPDRGLRRDTHEDVAGRRVRFPLRAAVCAVLMVAAGLALFFAPNSPIFAPETVSGGSADLYGAQREPLTRAVMCVVAAAMLPAALRFCTNGSSTDTRNIGIGAAIYAVAGIAAFVIRSDALNALLAAGGSVFLAASLWLLNDRAMLTGAASRIGVKPPATMRRRNRALLIVLMALSALVAGFSWLKEKTAWLARRAAVLLWRVIMWISDHMMPGQDSAGGGGGGGMDFSGLMDGDAKPSRFWEIMTYFAYVLAAVLLLLLLYLFVRKMAQLLRRLYRKLKDYLSRFAQAVSEDYHDEQESLLDWGEVQRDMGAALRKRFTALFQRDRKWDDMDARERARHIVRVLYRRAKLKPDGRTLRETLPELAAADSQLLAETYELARYADRDPDAAALEKLRRDVRA